MMNIKRAINVTLLLVLLIGSTSGVFAYDGIGWGRPRSSRQVGRQHPRQRGMFPPNRLSLSSHKFTGIERDIENLFLNTIKPIADELKKIKTGKQAEQAVSEKVKQREQKFQQMQRQRAQQSRYRRPSSSRYRSPYSRPFGRSPFGRSRYRSPRNSWQPGKRWSPGGFGSGSSPWRDTSSFSPSTWKPGDKTGQSSRAGVIDKKDASSKKMPTTSGGNNYTTSPGRKKKKVLPQLVKVRNLRRSVLQTMLNAIKQLKYPKRNPEADENAIPKANYKQDLIGKFATLAGQIAKMNNALDSLNPKQAAIERKHLAKTYKAYLEHFAKGFWEFTQRKFDDNVRGCKVIFAELNKVLGQTHTQKALTIHLRPYIEPRAKIAQRAIKELGAKRKPKNELKEIGKEWHKAFTSLEKIRAVLPYSDEMLDTALEVQEQERQRLIDEGKIVWTGNQQQ